jgi:site-specific DNA-methyltransferase (adenine-specific)
MVLRYVFHATGKSIERMANITLLNCDCLEYMATLPDKAFDLAIVDPPYGIKRDKGFEGFEGFGGFGKPIARTKYKGEWDSVRPDKTFFDELLRVSQHQIIWGGNFFTDQIPQANHWLFWDKQNTMPTFGDGELAWTSFDRNSVKRHILQYNGLLGRELERIHPTQKPIKLYEWLLTNYAKPGQWVLDTHLGSGSSAIAAHYFGVDFVGCELDTDYYNAAKHRFEQATAQLAMFCEGET